MCGGCGRRFSIDRSVLLAGEPQLCPHCGDVNADEPTHPEYVQPATLKPRRGDRPMPMPCSVCGHDQRHEIDRAIAGGQSDRHVAATFNVTDSSVRRHRQNHVEDATEPDAPEARRPIGDARADIEGQRTDAVIEIARLDAEVEQRAGEAARSPHALRLLEHSERQLHERRRDVERFDRMLTGLDQQEADERHAAEAARVAEVARVAADAEAELHGVLLTVEDLIAALSAASQRALDIDAIARRARVQARLEQPGRGVGALIEERVNRVLRTGTGNTGFRLHAEHARHAAAGATCGRQ